MTSALSEGTLSFSVLVHSIRWPHAPREERFCDVRDIHPLRAGSELAPGRFEVGMGWGGRAGQGKEGGRRKGGKGKAGSTTMAV